MSHRIKSFWDSWEKECIKQAFIEQIQHKVIVQVLGRSMNSVNQQIRKLNLREVTHTPGPHKGLKHPSHRRQKEDAYKRMQEIIQAFAPHEIQQTLDFPTQETTWIIKPKDAKQVYSSRAQHTTSSTPLFPSLSSSYILMDDIPPIDYRVTVEDQTIYVSLNYIEEWARNEGFYELKGSFPVGSASFWKEGKYYSLAQLLIHINELRIQNQLRPLNLDT